MMYRNKKLAVLGMALAPLIGLGFGCDSSQGPAEQAGEKIDQGVENAKDALDPRGPGEKAGEAVDKAADKAADAVDKATDKAADAIDKAADKVDEAVKP